MVIAYGLGVKRFGFSQKGNLANRFLHIGSGDKQLGFPPATWSY